MTPDAAPLPRTTLPDALLGALRVAAVLALVALGAGYVLAVAYAGGHRPARALAAAGRVCRLFCRVTGVALHAPQAERLAAHPGFVFFNHGSFLDVVVLLGAAPMRFLATAGVRRIPFIGRMADAAGTLYVDRGDGTSREAARHALRAALRAHPLPPVALAPEGGIHPRLAPFRVGAFEVAGDAGAPVLLVALRYSDPRRAAWHARETLLAPLWRLCARRTPFAATCEPLFPVLVPGEPSSRAREAERRLAEALGQPDPGAAPAAPLPVLEGGNGQGGFVRPRRSAR